MKFKSLYVIGFGTFDESMSPEKRFFKFDGSGINVVTGKNERGKSTLMEALLDTIYGIPGIRRDLRKPWGASRGYGARLEIESGDHTLQIERDFFTEQATITDITGGGSRVRFTGNANPRSRGGQARLYRETLQNLGIPSREVMEQLAFVRKMEMDSGVSDEIRRLVTGGGGINYHKVISRLIGRHFSLTRENPWQNFNKNRPRELENLKERLEEMEIRLVEVNQARDQLVDLEREMKTLEDRMEKMQHRWDRNRFLHKTFTEARELFEDLRHNCERLSDRIEHRDRLRHQRERRNEVDREIAALEKVFKDVKEPLPELCREMSLVQDRLEEIERQRQTREAEIQGMEQEKSRLEEDLYNSYPELVLFPSNFPDLVEENHRLKDQFAEGLEFYNRQLSAVRQLESALEEKEDFALRGGRFERQLESYISINQKINMELDFVDQKINTRRDTGKEISRAWEQVRKKYPGMDKMPQDLPAKVREYRAQSKNRELKSTQLDEKKVNYKKLRRKIQSPVNYLPVIAGLLIGLVIGLLFPQKLVAGALGCMVGTLAGAVVAWRRLQDMQVKKGRLEEAMDELETHLTGPLPALEVPEKFQGVDGLDKLLDQFRDYQAAVRNIEKMTLKATTMEAEDTLTRRRDALVLELETAREGAELEPGQDPLKVLEEYRTFIRQQDRLVDLIDGIRSRFPSALRGSLPPVPQELVKMKEKIDQFESEYPLAKGMPPFETLQARFREMLILKGKISELETLISHSRRNDPLGSKLKNEEARRDEIMSILSPLMEDMDIRDLPKLEQRYNRYLQLIHQLKGLTGEPGSSDTWEKAEEEVRELSARVAVLEARRDEMAGRMPALESFEDMTPPQQHQRLSELASQSDRLEQELLGARERQNYLTVKLENSSPPGDPESIREERDDLSTRVEHLEIMRDGYRLAVDTLRESVELFQKSHRQNIQEEISRIFSRLTNRRYGAVRLDSDFEITLEDPQGMPVQKEAISSGARDQLYLSVRMALARSLSEQVCLPFLLDDPLASFDRERLLTARKILEDLSREHQVIIFTHNRLFQDWGSLVCDLDALSGSPVEQMP